MAAERIGEHVLAVAPRRRLVHRRETGAGPGRGIGLDNERAHVRRVAVMVGVEDAVVIGAEGLGQGLEGPGRAEPGELVGKGADGSAEGLGAARPDQ